MQIFDGQLVYSATDLIGHGDCSHMTALAIAHKLNLVDIEPVKAIGMASLAGKRGGEHEQKALEHMRSEGRSVPVFTDCPDKSSAELIASLFTFWRLAGPRFQSLSPRLLSSGS